MIKIGITERGPRCQRALELEAAHKGWWPFAFTLLEDIENNYTPADEPLIERLYSALSAGDGVHKITRSNRFRELDDWLAAEIARRFAVGEKVVVHDMAASNGITSLELFDKLQTHQGLELHASDYFDHLLVVRIPDSHWTVVFDVEERPLQAVGGRFVISLQRDALKRHPVNRLVQAWVRRRVLPKAEQALSAAMREEAVGNGSFGASKVSLFHPLCQRRSRSDNRFQLRRHDLFQATDDQCDVVRVMNALTPHHFDSERLRKALAACIQSVRIGGLFVIGRSIDEEDSQTAASVYERTAAGLNPVWELNGGYEWASLVPHVVATPAVPVSPIAAPDRSPVRCGTCSPQEATN